MAPHRLIRRKPRSPGTTREVRVQDPAASMALIFDAMKRPIDPLYEDVARKREATGEGLVRRPGRSPLLVVTVIALGFLLGAAAHALRVPDSVQADRHAQLVEQVEAKQKANDDSAAEVEALRTELDSNRSSALTRQERSNLSADLTAGERTAGAAAVSGPGLTVVIENPEDAEADAADSDPRTGEDENALTSSDLQHVINGLWSSGATAVSVNGQRITSLSAVRFAGSAILVNYRPLATPYTVTAIGPSDMQNKFESGFSGDYLTSLRKSDFTISTSRGNVTVPAQGTIRIAHAQPVR